MPFLKGFHLIVHNTLYNIKINIIIYIIKNKYYSVWSLCFTLLIGIEFENFISSKINFTYLYLQKCYIFIYICSNFYNYI